MTHRRTMTQNQGFTIIELLLVLAVVGVIAVVVLLGFKGAERAQRDAAKKANVDGLISAINDYAKSHNGLFPTPVSCTLPDACTSMPGGWKPTYPVGGVATGTVPSGGWMLWMADGSSTNPIPCPGGGFGNNGKVAAALEAGGYYCQLY